MNLNQQQTAYLSDTYNRMEQKFRAECHRMNGRIPYISIDGAYPTWDESMINWWTNGFWGGIMWQLYHAENNSDYMSEANCLEEHLEKAFEHFDLLDHDVGFLWLHTAVAHYRLTGDPTARQRGLRAAAVLASRYCPAGEYIRAWNRPGLSQMIIDCVMNLPLLFWAASEGAGDHYRQIAIHHLDRVLTHIIREDGSCNHIVEFDEATGEVLNIPGGQGYGENSSWSRGQSWAIYGLALAYRYTKKTSYLNAAKTVAHYFLANIALTDYVSLIDFRAPADPVYYDKQYREILKNSENVRYISNSSGSVIDAVRNNAGICIMPLRFAEEGLICLDNFDWNSHISIYLFSRKRVKDLPRVRAVINYFKEILQRM